nr:putative late blight resistance protein homolog R1B-16 isoform X1 [Ipomoea batatas]
MAYAAVTSLKGTLHLHFFPLEREQKIVNSLHENLSFLQKILEKSEIASYDNSAMKRLEAKMRDVAFEAEERIEMELSSIYIQSSSEEACLLRLQGIFNQAVKQTDYLKKKLIKIKTLSISTGGIPLKLKLFEHWTMQSFIVQGCCVILNSSEASRIWKMPLLRNFYVEKNPITLEASEVVHRNIETIFWLRPECCEEDLFTRIPNLKELGVEAEMDFENENSYAFYNFVLLEQLEKLSIRGWHFDIEDWNIHWATSFLPNLKKLNFFKTELPWSNMRVIGMLPNLEVLKLKHACQGKNWKPSEEGFRQLKKLVIESNCLEYWNAVGDHFPVLERLELSDCDSLRKIPVEFADITTLALIQLKKCLHSVLVSALCIQDEQRRYGNDGLCVRSKHIQQSGSGHSRGVQLGEDEISREASSGNRCTVSGSRPIK